MLPENCANQIKNFHRPPYLPTQAPNPQPVTLKKVVTVWMCPGHRVGFCLSLVPEHIS